jgi:hypothetical protein
MASEQATDFRRRREEARAICERVIETNTVLLKIFEAKTQPFFQAAREVNREKRL